MNAFLCVSLGLTPPNLIRLSPAAHAETPLCHDQCQAGYRTLKVCSAEAEGHSVTGYHTQPSSTPPARRFGRAVRLRALLGAASLVLALAQRLQRGGLLAPDQAALALRCSGKLLAKAMVIWRRGRSRGDC